MTSPPDSLIASQLESGERLVWAGAPRGGIRFRKQDLFMVPFSLMWGGFAIFWEVSVLAAARRNSLKGAGVIFPLWGIPFVLIGLYLIVGRFFYDAYVRSRTAYGVTNQRVMIVREGFSRQVKSLQLRTLSDVTLDESGDGSGTITFGPGAPSLGGFPGSRRGPVAPCFEMIERAKSVYDLIRSAQTAER